MAEDVEKLLACLEFLVQVFVLSGEVNTQRDVVEGISTFVISTSLQTPMIATRESSFEHS